MRSVTGAALLREDEVDGEAESAGVSGSGIKLVGLMFKLDPSSSETPQRPELSSTPLLTLPSLPLCCCAWTKPATRTRWPMLSDISRQMYHVVNWHVNANMYGFQCNCVTAERRRRHKQQACLLPCQVDLKIPVNHRKGPVKITNWNVVYFESLTEGSAAVRHCHTRASLHPGQQVRAAGKARCVPAVTCLKTPQCLHFTSPVLVLLFLFLAHFFQ